MTGMMTVETMAAISQDFEAGFLENAETMAIKYIANINMTPARARGRFHLMGIPHFLCDYISFYYSGKIVKKEVFCFDP